LSQVEQTLGQGQRDAVEARSKELALLFQTTFASSLENAQGTVSASMARHAIHRFFAQHHGWHIRGLSTSLPPNIVDLLQQYEARDDFELGDVAVLTAMVETMVHSETRERLLHTYRVLGMDSDSRLGEQEAVQLIQTYMAAFLAGHNISQLTRPHAHHVREHAMQSDPHWAYSEKLLSQMRKQLFPGRSEFSFSDTVKIVEAINDQIGIRIDQENCEGIHDRLLQIEKSTGIGRVRLHDFYASHLKDNNLHASESVEFLRQLGVLDESNPSAPDVIIPNYLISKANCLNVSSFYNLCCMDTCGDLLGHIESHIQATQATPEEILSLVSMLPSATPSADLVAKLHTMAQQHGGTVSLHGLSFAQWMHFAYPRDCPYPHNSGFFMQNEMGSYTSRTDSTRTQSGSATVDGQDEELCSGGGSAWAADEQISGAVSPRLPRTAPPSPADQVGSDYSLPRAFAFLMVLASSVWVMVGLAKQTLAEAGRAQLELGMLTSLRCMAKSEQHTA